MKFLSFILALAVLAPGRAGAGSQPLDAHAIVQKMIERNPSLRSFSAHVHVDARMTSFPFYSPKLDGTSYFKRPDNFEVKFDHVPRFAGGLDHFFSDLADPTTWERRFNMRVDGERTIGDHRYIEMTLVAKIRGMIDHTTVYVDPKSFEIAQLQWHYYNGGLITMDQTYQTVANYRVLATQHATVAVPHIRAVADAQYTDYRTNVAISDSVFQDHGK